MDSLIIEKSAMKFTIEIVSTNGQLSFNVVRYIEVGKNECMETNAKLAKHDALKINGHYVNCNDLLRAAMDGVESKTLPVSVGLKKEKKIRLKKTYIFGY